MCTLSWLNTKKNYQLFFNRDEQKIRKKAISPQYLERKGVKVLMPIDPEGGGSWLSVNEYGVSLCLLNYYQGVAPPKPLVSRGQLLSDLSHHATLNALRQQIDSINLLRYAPFTLVVFSNSLDCHSSGSIVRGYQWNGANMRHFNPQSPITSSSVNFEKVSLSRNQKYEQYVKSRTTDELTQYHSSHDIEKEGQSVCMHRTDAKTVSFSHIAVKDNNVTFSYQDDSPCKFMERTVSKMQTRILIQEADGYK